MGVKTTKPDRGIGSVRVLSTVHGTKNLEIVSN
jgi:hypothetical protein